MLGRFPSDDSEEWSEPEELPAASESDLTRCTTDPDEYEDDE